MGYDPDLSEPANAVIDKTVWTGPSFRESSVCLSKGRVTDNQVTEQVVYSLLPSSCKSRVA